MIFYIALLIIFFGFLYIKFWLDYRYKGTMPIQIKIIKIQKLCLVSIVFSLFGYKAYKIQGEGEKRRYYITVIVKKNRIFKRHEEIKIIKIVENNYLGEQMCVVRHI